MIGDGDAGTRGAGQGELALGLTGGAGAAPGQDQPGIASRNTHRSVGAAKGVIPGQHDGHIGGEAGVVGKIPFKNSIRITASGVIAGDQGSELGDPGLAGKVRPVIVHPGFWKKRVVVGLSRPQSRRIQAVSNGRLPRGFLVHIEMTVVVDGVGIIVSPGGRHGGDIQPAQVEVPRKITGNRSRSKAPQRGAVRVAPGINIPAPGLGGDSGSGESWKSAYSKEESQQGQERKLI